MNTSYSSQTEKMIAERRDAILMFVLEGRVTEARDELGKLIDAVDPSVLTKSERSEFACRLLESELDIAEREQKPVHAICNVLKRVLVSQDFNEDRRREILLRGLNRLEQNGDR